MGLSQFCKKLDRLPTSKFCLQKIAHDYCLKLLLVHYQRTLGKSQRDLVGKWQASFLRSEQDILFQKRSQRGRGRDNANFTESSHAGE